MYVLKDLGGEKIEGTFYVAELQIVEKGDDALNIKEKVLNRRKRRGKAEYIFLGGSILVISMNKHYCAISKIVLAAILKRKNSFGKVVFQIQAKIEMMRIINRLFGRHFETVQRFTFFQN